MFRKICFCIVLVLLSYGQGMAAPGDVLGNFKAPGHFPTGMTYDGRYLWVADRGTDSLYQLSSDGTIQTAIPAPGYSPTGLAWDGSHLWCIDDKENYLYRLNIENGVSERIIEAYTNHPKDICWDGELIWVADNKLDILLSVDPDDGMMISKIPSPSKEPDGLAFDGTCLWVSDRSTDRIYRVQPETGTVILSIHAPDKHARGLAWDGSTLWNADYQSDRIYELKIDDDARYKTYDHKRQKLDNIFEFRNYGPGTVTELDVYIAIPEDRDNQTLLSPVAFDPEPAGIVTDQWEQKFAHYRIKNMASGQQFRAVLTINAKIKAVEYFIDPDKVGRMSDIPKSIREKYLADGKKLQLTDPFIQNTARQIVGDESNPYWIARKIFNYLIGHLSYNLKPVGGWNPAPTVLKRGTASCSEYSFAFIALGRAVGLPVRYVGAVSLRGDDASLDEVFHRWCEVYLPNYGWIPFDANKGDDPRPADQAEGIGNISSRYVITTTSGGGSEYMDWTYNFNWRWKSRDKCRIHTEHYGEWSPLDE